MKLFIPSVFVFFLSACASQYYVRDEHKPVQLLDQRAMYEKIPEAEVAGVFHATEVFRRKRSRSTNPSIKGRCMVRTVRGSNINVPCTDVIVVLEDTKGQTVARSPVESGAFEFFVKRGKSFSLKVDSHRYVLRKKHAVSVEVGDDVILTLSPKYHL